MVTKGRSVPPQGPGFSDGLGLRFDLPTCHQGAAPFSRALYDPGWWLGVGGVDLSEMQIPRGGSKSVTLLMPHFYYLSPEGHTARVLRLLDMMVYLM